MVLTTVSYKYPRDDPNALIHKAHHSSFQTKVNDDDNPSSPQNKVWIIDEKTGLLFASVTEWIDFIESGYRDTVRYLDSRNSYRKKEFSTPKPAPEKGQIPIQIGNWQN